MSDRFACGIAEQMIPRYAGGKCTESEKKFLEKHCAECIECSVRLIHEKNKLEAAGDRQFDRDYAAESADSAGASVHVYDAGQEEAQAEAAAGSGETPYRDTERRSYGRGLDARAIVAVTVLIISMTVGIIAVVFVVIGREMSMHLQLQDYLELLEEDESGEDEYGPLSDYSGPIVLSQDHVIEWKDPVLEETVRGITGIETEDIMYSDVLSITWIDLSCIDEEEGQITDISNLAEFRNLKGLHLSYNGIEDISPLQELTDMEYLSLGYNRIHDLEPLREMKNLTYLYLTGNQVSDLGPLEDLTNLECLELDDNQIYDISPLGNLENMDILSLSGNHITDITPLQDMESLTWLNLGENEIRNADILEDLPSLEQVVIWDNPIEDESVLDRLEAEVSY